MARRHGGQARSSCGYTRRYAQKVDRGELPVPRAFRPARGKNAAAQVYSVRIPVDRIAQLRAVAEDIDVAPSALLREWVLERLDQETSAVESMLSGALTASNFATTSTVRMKSDPQFLVNTGGVSSSVVFLADGNVEPAGPANTTQDDERVA